MTVAEVAHRTVRGQYGPGTVNGKTAPGYRKERGVKPDSKTETFAAVEFHIHNWRWAGVPFYVRTGKHLAESVTEVRVHFKRTPQALFARDNGDKIESNIISLRIQPNEGIAMTFEAKLPGTQMRASTVQMDFSYQSAFGSRTPVAYETLLLDAMRGDAHCSRAEMKLKRNGESSRPSKMPGSNCRCPTSPTTLRVVKARLRQTNLWSVTAITGARCEKKKLRKNSQQTSLQTERRDHRNFQASGDF